MLPWSSREVQAMMHGVRCCMEFEAAGSAARLPWTICCHGPDLTTRTRAPFCEPHFLGWGVWGASAWRFRASTAKAFKVCVILSRFTRTTTNTMKALECASTLNRHHIRAQGDVWGFCYDMLRFILERRHKIHSLSFLRCDNIIRRSFRGRKSSGTKYSY